MKTSLQHHILINHSFIHMFGHICATPYTLTGPQIKLINSSFWEEHVNAYIHTALPMSELLSGYEYKVLRSMLNA